jgi:magnesium-protoporphyrin O-methyltransferase
LAFGAAVAAAILALHVGRDSSEQAVDDMRIVTEYSNGEGFSCWCKFYGETDEVYPVQKDIRVGHVKTVGKILGSLVGKSIYGKAVCDAGSGTGIISIPLVSRGPLVSGSEISAATVLEAAARKKATLQPDSSMPNFETRDLEVIQRVFECVCCVGVPIHYPPVRLDSIVGNIAKLSKESLILSFAPKTRYYVALERLGVLFLGKSKTPMHICNETTSTDFDF